MSGMNHLGECIQLLELAFMVKAGGENDQHTIRSVSGVVQEKSGANTSCKAVSEGSIAFGKIDVARTRILLHNWSGGCISQEGKERTGYE